MDRCIARNHALSALLNGSLLIGLAACGSGLSAFQENNTVDGAEATTPQSSQVVFTCETLKTLPGLHDVSKTSSTANIEHNIYAAAYTPLYSSPEPLAQLGNNLTLVLNAQAGQLAYAIYEFAGLDNVDYPERLTVIGANDDMQLYIAYSDFGAGTWRWEAPPSLSGIRQVELGRHGPHSFSGSGVFYAIVAIYNSGSETLFKLHVATSNEVGLQIPQAMLTERTMGAATLKVWTAGVPASPITIAELGPGDPVLLPQGLEYGSFTYDISLPSDSSLVRATLDISPFDQSLGSAFAAVSISHLSLAGFTENGEGGLRTMNQASGQYVLVSLSPNVTGKNPTLAQMNGYYFADDSWPIGNCGGGNYDITMNGWCWGMSAGAQYYLVDGKTDFLTQGLFHHFNSDDEWAQGCAAYLQHSISTDVLNIIFGLGVFLPQDWNPVKCIARMEAARLLSGCPPIVCRSGWTGTWFSGHVVLYIGTDWNYAYFSNPDKPYEDLTNQQLVSVQISKLPEWEMDVFTGPELSDFAITPGLSSSLCESVFNPANRSEIIGATFPQVTINAGVTPFVIHSLDDVLPITFSGAFWNDHPEYNTIKVLCILDEGDDVTGSRFTSLIQLPKSSIETAGGIPISQLLIAGLSPQGLQRGTTILIKTIQAWTADDYWLTSNMIPSINYMYYDIDPTDCLLSPRAITATDGVYPEKVVVTWIPPNQGSTPTGYNVYRKQYLGGQPWGVWYRINGAPIAGSLYNDIGAERGKHYLYSICSYDAISQMESTLSQADEGWRGEAGTSGRGDWYMYGHDPQRTSCSAFVGPQTAANVRIVANLVCGSGAPVFDSNNHILVVSSYNDSLYCFSETDLLVWSYDALPGLMRSATIDTNGKIYCGGQQVLCLDSEGIPLWGISASISNLVILGNNSLIGRGTVNEISGIHLFDSEGNYSCILEAYTPGSKDIAIDTNGVIYNPTLDLLAVSSSGSLLWSYHDPGGFNPNSPAIGQDGTIYAAFHDSESGKLCAISPNGILKWEQPAAPGDKPAIAVDGSIILVSRGNTESYISSYIPQGTRKWQLIYEDVSDELILGADGTIYTSIQREEKFFVIAIDANKSKKWEFETEAYANGLAINNSGSLYATISQDLYLFGP